MPPPSPSPVFTLDRVVRMVLTAIGVVAGFALVRHLSDVLLPFAAAVILAYLLNPLVNVFERKTRRRGLAVLITIGGLAVSGLAVVALVVPLIFSQANRLRLDLERLREDLSATAPGDSTGHGRGDGKDDAASVVEPAPSLDAARAPSGSDSPSAPAAEEESALGWRELAEGWARYRGDAGVVSRAARLRQLRESVAGTYVGQLLDSAVEYTRSDEFRALLIGLAKRLALGGWTVIAFGVNVVLALTGLVIVLVYLVFLLLDFPEYQRQWKAFLPPDYAGAIVEFLDLFNGVLRRYLRGQSLVALFTGTLYVVGFTLIGLPMAVPLGLFIGLLNLVPYLQAVGLVPAAMLAGLRAIEGDSSFLMSLVWTLAVFGAVQVIQDTLITPRVMGEATGLKPVAILLGVFIWGKLLGFIGLLMAIPLTCLGIAYYRRYVLKHSTAATDPPRD
ncbi:MAG: AI-2E family transporter [Planctomycetes bacterium]|nr:AI-2E family transporter [Planctomycetota bacterium]